MAELGEMLPNTLKIKDSFWSYHLHYLNGKYGCGAYYQYYEPNDKRWHSLELKGHGTSVMADTEADARAKMLIYLIENKLMDVPQ